MFIPRVIPVLLLKGKGLVKTIQFRATRYIGEPINAVKIFNDLKADELILLDISATNENRTISVDLVKEIGDEAFMPFAVGGGISTVESAVELINAGAEKVVVNSSAIKIPELISDLAKEIGSQSIVVSIDVKKNIFGNYIIYSNSGKKKKNGELLDIMKNIESMGAGEILINNISNDGMMRGYDYELIKFVSSIVNIPVIACGGAGTLKDLKYAYQAGAHAIAAGSLFVYHGNRRAVLINYPTKADLIEIFNDNSRI